MLPEPPDLHRFAVLADHEQFYLQDLDAYALWMRSHATDPDLAPAGWTHEAVHLHRIGVEPHSIAVGTARSGVVETILRFHRAPPLTGFEDAEHIVEADVDLPNGDMAIYGPADDPGQEQHVSVTAGRYRARVSYVPSGPPTTGADESGYGRHFIYWADLWPTGESAPLTVLKQGPNPW